MIYATCLFFCWREFESTILWCSLPKTNMYPYILSQTRTFELKPRFSLTKQEELGIVQIQDYFLFVIYIMDPMFITLCKLYKNPVEGWDFEVLWPIHSSLDQPNASTLAWENHYFLELFYQITQKWNVFVLKIIRKLFFTPP